MITVVEVIWRQKKRDVTAIRLNRKYWKSVVIYFKAVYLAFCSTSSIKFNPHICYTLSEFLELAVLKMRSEFIPVH
jgi:hypothetical protein